MAAGAFFSRLFRLPYLLLMGPIRARAHRRYLGQLDELARRLASRVHMDEEGLVCIYGRPGTGKGRFAHRIRLFTSIPCFDDVRHPAIAQDWRRHAEGNGKVAFVTVQACSKAEAERFVQHAAAGLGIALPFSIYFVELPSLAESWGKPVIAGATGPDNGYGPTITTRDLERDPELAARYRNLKWPGKVEERED
jgi:hypothetical protein